MKSPFNKVAELKETPVYFKETHREKTPLNKTEALTKETNMYIWAIGILNQLFLRDSYTQIKFSRKWSSVVKVHSLQ